MVVRCSIKGTAVCLKRRLKPTVTKPFLTVCLLLFIGQPSYAIETTRAKAFSKVDDTSHSQLSSGTKDTCLHLLNHAQSKSITDGPYALSPQSSQNALAVGLVLGLRAALGPTEVIKQNQRHASGKFARLPDKNGSLALATAQYRQCKSNETLKNMNIERSVTQ